MSQLGFWPFTSSHDDPAQDHDSGLNIMEAFFEEASMYPEFQFSSFDEYANFLESKVPDFISNVGEIVRLNYASTTEGDAINRMRQLADSTHGQASVSQIMGTAGGSGQSVNWTAAIPEVGAQTASDAGTFATDTLVNVGKGVSATLALTKYMPWILCAAGAIYLWSLGGGKIKNFLPSFKK